jgi:uroporphyrinogen decarboxylase
MSSVLDRNNYLKAVRFETPDYIPMNFHINGACFHHYPQEFLFEQMAAHRRLFPEFKQPGLPFWPDFSPVARKDEPWLDDFGCLWSTTDDGITGTVVRHPLENLAGLGAYRFPDPEICTGIGPVSWLEVDRKIRQDREAGRLTGGGLRHGHTFLQLCDIRGYENLLLDMADEDERLDILIDGIEQFNRYGVHKYISFGVDLMEYPEDLGMQTGPMLSPELFRKYIKPSYQRLMKPARDNGILVHMHSDGDIRTLADDLIDGGVDIINLQDLVNGIDWIAARFAGKICVDLDVDRQKITARGTPEQIDALILEEIQKLGSRQGGLMLVYGLYPGVPRENIVALMDAMEHYMDYFG